MKRAPKKFTDNTQSEITPEWRAWYDEAKNEATEDLIAEVRAWGFLPQDVWPEVYDKGIGDGAWIFVVEEPYTELKARFTIPTPSLWWARPEEARIGAKIVKGWGGGVSAVMPGLARVVIETPGGSLWLFPHEYVVCENPLPLLTDPDVTIHPLGGRVSLDEEKSDQLFYLQQRGIPYADALLMIMDGVDMSQWGWVEFPEEARAMFDGVGSLRRLG